MSAMSSKIVFASLISTATLFGTLAIESVANAAPTVNCTIPNNVSCDISSSKGIKSVKFENKTQVLVNESYANCPTSVTVTWDSAYHSSSHDIVECAGISGGGGGSGSGKPGRLKG